MVEWHVLVIQTNKILEIFSMYDAIQYLLYCTTISMFSVRRTAVFLGFVVRASLGSNDWTVPLSSIWIRLKRRAYCCYAYLTTSSLRTVRRASDVTYVRRRLKLLKGGVWTEGKGNGRRTETRDPRPPGSTRVPIQSIPKVRSSDSHLQL
jgi:hypothetical protein